MRRTAIVIATLLTVCPTLASSDFRASYLLRVTGFAPPRLEVEATLPGGESALEMALSRPGDVAELNSGGWPALVTEMSCTDAEGRPITLTRSGPKGWTMDHAPAGRVTVRYRVDYALLAERGWPAPREAAFADPTHLVVIGRSLFVRSPGQRESLVSFVLPEGWRAVAPWDEGAKRGTWRVASKDDLSENLVVFTSGATVEFSAGRFRFHVVPIGWWEGARAEVRRVVEGPLTRLAKMMVSDDRGAYTIVLLPTPESGGESFRSSFALTQEETPSARNVGLWGNLLAHEFFHYWNGSRLQGADYQSTNWVREGFTEYAANLAMVGSAVWDESAFRAKLAKHVDNYGRLATPLDAPGDHKGPPLYSGGALVAFCWDTKIREATRGERGFADVLRALWRRTDGGTKPFVWSDIEASLQSVAAGDWNSFHSKYIHGDERLPLKEAFASVGLRLSKSPEGATVVEIDATSSKDARIRWRAWSNSNAAEAVR